MRTWLRWCWAWTLWTSPRALPTGSTPSRGSWTSTTCTGTSPIYCTYYCTTILIYHLCSTFLCVFVEKVAKNLAEKRIAHLLGRKDAEKQRFFFWRGEAENDAFLKRAHHGRKWYIFKKIEYSLLSKCWVI